MNATRQAPRVLIVGGGYVGMYTALRMQHKLRRGEAEITLIDPRSYMTYQPFLPEAAAGNLSPRHVVVPLRRVLPHCNIISASVTRIDHEDRSVEYQPVEGQTQRISYDILVYAPGSVSKTLPIPGLAECGIGFQTIGEAIGMRNHVISQLDLAQSTDDPEIRRRALTFVFVGAGFAGVEALGELEDMARDACRWYPGIAPEDMHWLLVEATGRILPEVGEDMGRWTLEQLREWGIDVRLNTTLKSAEEGHVVLGDGTDLIANTLVWTAGVKPHPLVEATDLPRDDRDRVTVTPQLSVVGVADAYCAGNAAAVPDLTKPGEYCAPNAQHAVRQAKVLANNIVSRIRGGQAHPYRHAYVGSVASLGLHKGVAQVYGIKARGWPAWFMHRTYHLARVPTFNRKVRVVADWTMMLFFRREIVSLAGVQRPREEFELATRPSYAHGRLRNPTT